jgi:hypothetical protein
VSVLAAGTLLPVPAIARSAGTASEPITKSPESYHSAASSSGQERIVDAASMIHCARLGRAVMPHSAIIRGLLWAAPQA